MFSWLILNPAPRQQVVVCISRTALRICAAASITTELLSPPSLFWLKEPQLKLPPPMIATPPPTTTAATPTATSTPTPTPTIAAFSPYVGKPSPSMHRPRRPDDKLGTVHLQPVILARPCSTSRPSFVISDFLGCLNKTLKTSCGEHRHHHHHYHQHHRHHHHHQPQQNHRRCCHHDIHHGISTITITRIIINVVIAVIIAVIIGIVRANGDSKTRPPQSAKDQVLDRFPGSLLFLVGGLKASRRPVTRTSIGFGPTGRQRSEKMPGTSPQYSQKSTLCYPLKGTLL